MRRSFCTFIIVILAPAGIIFFNSCKSVEINAPDMIVIDKGERFCVDDYVKISGGKSTEFRDNINTGKEGIYSLTVTAESKIGKSVTKEIKVVVE